MLRKISLLSLVFINAILIKAQSWSELGTGNNALNADDYIRSICPDPSGNIYAAGSFTNANYKSYVAKWNGFTWAELGTGANALNPNYDILTICSDPLGNIYAAGNFSNASHKLYVAKWDGTTWSELGATTWSGLDGTSDYNPNNSITSICSDPSGNIYAAGKLQNLSNKWYVAKWDGSTWSELGTGANALNANETINSIYSDAAGNIYAAGEFTNTPNPYNGGYKSIKKWNGTNWSELSGTNYLDANNSIYSICSDPLGNIYAAGNFKNGSYKWYVAKWNGTTWSELGTGSKALNANSTIVSVYSDAAGNIYAAGLFTNGYGKQYVAKWDGSSWSELGGANSLNANGVIQVCSGQSGNIYAGGRFTNASGKYYVAKFENVATAILPLNIAPINFYPNPTKSNLTIESPEEGQVIIYNSLGEVKATQNIKDGKQIISLDKLETGVYTVYLKGQNNTYAPAKFVKE